VKSEKWKVKSEKWKMKSEKWKVKNEKLIRWCGDYGEKKWGFIQIFNIH